MRNFEATPVIIVNLNLHPSIRYAKENIMTSMIIPGPSKPKKFDSFLFPLVEELKSLNAGVEAYDSARKSEFVLHAWPVLVTEDGPALAEVMGFKRPGNAIRACRFCKKKSKQISNRGHYYLPHNATELVEGALFRGGPMMTFGERSISLRMQAVII